MVGTDRNRVEPFVHHDDFISQLRDLEVPEDLISGAWKVAKGPAWGVLVYGSRARRDADNYSDLDLLILSDIRGGTSTTEKVSTAFYSRKQLQAASNTLYGMHLVRDGIILHDPKDELRGILSTFTSPDPDNLMRRVQEFCVILDASQSEREKYLPGLIKTARYLLRTATYARAMKEGRPCFSVNELAVRFDQPELARLLSSHVELAPAPSIQTLDDLASRLSLLFGKLPTNPYGSLHALIVATATTNPDTSHLATLTLGVGDSIPYSEIPKVVL